MSQIQEDIFGKLPNTKKLEIMQYAQQHGAYAAAKEYTKDAGISVNGLYKRLVRELEPAKEKEESNLSPLNQARKAARERKEGQEVKLSKKEKQFLKDLESGKASLEDASRLVAVRVFEKMLKQPGNVKFLDFFRVELLKIKKMEAETKKTWAVQFLSRMMGGGELPPPVCPNCGHELIPGGNHVLEGETIYDAESISTTSDN